MTLGRTHEIKLKHNWGTPESYEFAHKTYEIVSACKDCGSLQRTLDITKTDEPSLTLSDLLSTSTESERKQAFKELKKIAQQLSHTSEQIQQMDRDLFSGTEFAGIADFASKIKPKYENVLDDSDITFGLAKKYLQVGKNKKARRKALLALKQGMVCNRCDQIYPFDQLTQDEIRPKSLGGQAKLSNQQLLCSRCNKAKDSNEPGPKDRSPFTNEQPPCVHQVSCLDVGWFDTSVRSRVRLPTRNGS